MDGQAQLLAILGELARPLHGGALLDVLQNLRVAGFVADDQQAAARVFHGLQSFEVGGHARGAGPGHPQRLQLRAKLDGARLLDVEGIVVEEELLDLRPILLGLRHFGGDLRRRERLRQGCPLSVCGHRQKVHCAGQPRVV